MTIYHTNTEKRARATADPASKKNATVAGEALPHRYASGRSEELMAIAEHRAALPVLDGRDADEILGYDGRGLPV